MVVNCEQMRREISNYVDGDVSADMRSAMEDHFQSCRSCAGLLAGVRDVVRLYGDERMLEVPAGFGARLEARLSRRRDAKQAKWSSWSAWLIPAAAMLLIAGGVKLGSTFLFHPPAKSILAEPPKDIPPEMQVVVSNGSKLFHRPGCDFIHDKNSERTMTAKEAMQQGYAPCSRCLREYLKTRIRRRGDRKFAAAAADRSDYDIEAAVEIRHKGAP
jgi:Putative zinc-finger